MLGGNFIRNAGTVLSRHFKSTSTQSTKTPQHERQQQRVNPFAVFFLFLRFRIFDGRRFQRSTCLNRAEQNKAVQRALQWKRCLETLEDREREMGELRATVHSKEKDAEDATHKFNACELKLSGHHEKKLTGAKSHS